MLLSKLEIKGFKSFGEKVTLNFDKGITAVVGPNGSGKSNVVDAIRWVLGEQSTKALRSEKMDNIIFNGTKSRRPLQMAEVYLTFINNKNLLPTEYTEVTIGRRFYRSGEGEYSLNGVPCRLKDIHGLFLDTGIGSDSYAIIELKMIDEILNDTQNARRTLFEEAAGISKFKKSKKETLKKLKDTDADLERVDDLLFEVEKNMRSLERQAKQAQRYIKLKKTYKESSIQLALKKVDSQAKELNELADNMTAKNEERNVTIKTIEELEASIAKEKKESIDKETLFASRQKTLNEHILKMRQIESEKRIKGERKRFLEEKKQTLETQSTLDREAVALAQQGIESLQIQLGSIERMVNETEAELTKTQQERDTQTHKSDELEVRTKEFEQQVKNKQSIIFQLKQKVEINEVQLSALKQELERAHVESSEKSSSLAEFDTQFASLEGERLSASMQYEEVKEKHDLHQQKIHDCREELEGIKDRSSEILRSLDAKRNEHALTKSLVDNLEGYPEAIKYLKQETDWAKEAPMLSDTLHCEDDYRVAIEGYLAPYLNYFVLENEDEAWRAVNLLEEMKKGKANFLLLDKFEGYSPSPRKAIEDAISAIDVVDFDDKYASLITYLLDGVYIVHRNQNNLPKNDSVILVTKNGKAIRRKSAITGGSIGSFEGKSLGRIRHLENLTEEINALEKEAEEIHIKKVEKQQLHKDLLQVNFSHELESAQHNLQIVSQELIKIKTQKEEFAKFLKASANKKEEILERIGDAEIAISEGKPQLEDETYAMEYMTEQLEEMQENLAIEKEKKTEYSSKYNQLHINFLQQENQFNGLQKEIDFKDEELVKAQNRIDQNIEEIEKVEQDLLRADSLDEEGDQELIKLEEEKQNIERGVQEAEKAYQDAKDLISDTEVDIKLKQVHKEEIDQELLKANERINALRLSLTSVKEKIAVEFEVDIEQMLLFNPKSPSTENEEGEKTEEEENPYKEMGIAELEQISEDSKRKLGSLGAINHTAIDAFNEIKERNSFILSQREDLNKAKEQLLQTIEDIDAVAQEKFMKAFVQIRENFMEVFRSLFTDEDNCDLRLADDNDPLNAKIEILAQPKGKRPLTINQLSGGEKTLTATALLFAIYLIKPAPFCIFDEVDAPLDDANVDKFNRIINKFSSNSQFIIVTHNKRTMSSTDVIYGVTMIEQGVTTVVPVDIRNTPQLDAFTSK
ncbi:chromosome segregation protein SMC [Flammeovirga sp. SJP92]|uniref:chromosome segregation protein SMC n=1 Tax=Flammeovirga sp. SJP92 TaxID=1775430 RepID=UPI00078828F1|nr:chromosome segregation protein SMC [Flammeovirga sp. SJP92]KXX70129.1 chromosome segregation protein SMC [Flammeovirga sp. SJP92]